MTKAAGGLYVTKPFTALQLSDLVSQVSGPGHGP